MQAHALPPAPALRIVDPRRVRRQRLLLIVCWLATVLLAWLIGRHWIFPSLDGPQAQLLDAHQQIASLKERLSDAEQRAANLGRAEQIARLANENVQSVLADREATISELRRDLALYNRLVGPQAAGQGLAVHEVVLTPGEHGVVAMDVVLTQTRDVRGGSQGHVTVSVEGQRAGRTETLPWEDLAAAGSQDGLAFQFRYFQRLQASLVLPPDFQPHALEVHVRSKGQDTVRQKLRWDQLVNEGSV